MLIGIRSALAIVGGGICSRWRGNLSLAETCFDFLG